jgi:hypothetical protein
MKAFTYLTMALPASTRRRAGLGVLLATMGIAASLPARPDGTAKLTPPPPVFVLGVAPLVAAPGVPRTLTMSGYFPTGCAPVAVRIVPPVIATTRRELGIVLVVPPATPACAQDFALYSLQASYTPEVAGQEEVIAYTDGGALAGRGTIVTAAATLPRARRDVAGAWYDPATNGSGMMIAHDYGGTDQIFVTWQIYDATGQSALAHAAAGPLGRRGHDLRGHAVRDALGRAAVPGVRRAGGARSSTAGGGASPSRPTAPTAGWRPLRRAAGGRRAPAAREPRALPAGPDRGALDVRAASRRSASRYLSEVRSATSRGTSGAGGLRSKPMESSQFLTYCLSKLSGLAPTW